MKCPASAGFSQQVLKMHKLGMSKLHFVYWGLLVGAVYWLLESTLHAFIFTPELSLMQTLAGEHDPNEIIMRLIILLLMAGMGLVFDVQSALRLQLLLRSLKLNQLLHFLSRINQVVQHLTESRQVFEQVCQAAVEKGGFQFAWIGLQEGESSKLRPVAKAAHSSDCLTDVQRAGSDSVPCSLATEAIASGRPAHCNLMTEIQCRAAWRGPLLAHGCRSAAAFPVLLEHKPIGAFCVYADDGGFFMDDEIRILDEVADDVSHTLSQISAMAQLREEQSRLRQSEAALASAQRLAHLGSWEWNLQEKKLSWSDELYHVFGVEHGGGPSYRAFLNSVHPEDRKSVAASIRKVLRKRVHYRRQFRVRRPDGNIRFVYVKASPEYDDAGRPIRMSGVAQDITERKRAEEALRERLEELERFQQATVQREFRIKELRDEIEHLKAEIASASPGNNRG